MDHMLENSDIPNNDWFWLSIFAGALGSTASDIAQHYLVVEY